MKKILYTNNIYLSRTPYGVVLDFKKDERSVSKIGVSIEFAEHLLRKMKNLLIEKKEK